MPMTVEEAVCRWVVWLTRGWPDLHTNYDGEQTVELMISMREKAVRWGKYANAEVVDGRLTLDCQDDLVGPGNLGVPLDDPEFFERAAEMLAREFLTDEEFELARTTGWRRIGKDGRVKWPRSQSR